MSDSILSESYLNPVDPRRSYLVGIGQWVSVADGLPTGIDQDYLCTHVCENCLKKHLFNPKVWISEFDGVGFYGAPRHYYGEVTHYMPVPKPPALP